MTKTLDELCIGDVLLLPIPYGESGVIRLPFFDPGERAYCKIIVGTQGKRITLICTRNMYFEYVRGAYDK